MEFLGGGIIHPLIILQFLENMLSGFMEFLPIIILDFEANKF